MHITLLAAELAGRYDIDPDAARTVVETYAGQLQDETLYNAQTEEISRLGAKAIRDKFAADYHGATPVAEKHDELLDGIRAIAEEVTEAERQVDELMARRDALIRRAMEVGVRRSAIADAANVQLARLYQIRDGRR